jgi:hypothetical protein
MLHISLPKIIEEVSQQKPIFRRFEYLAFYLSPGTLINEYVGASQNSEKCDDPKTRIWSYSGRLCSMLGVKKSLMIKVSDSRSERPGLSQALGMLRDGDTLVVWKLDSPIWRCFVIGLGGV